MGVCQGILSHDSYQRVRPVQLFKIVYIQRIKLKIAGLLHIIYLRGSASSDNRSVSFGK